MKSPLRAGQAPSLHRGRSREARTVCLLPPQPHMLLPGCPWHMAAEPVSATVLGTGSLGSRGLVSCLFRVKDFTSLARLTTGTTRSGHILAHHLLGFESPGEASPGPFCGLRGRAAVLSSPTRPHSSALATLPPVSLLSPLPSYVCDSLPYLLQASVHCHPSEQLPLTTLSPPPSPSEFLLLTTALTTT